MLQTLSFPIGFIGISCHCLSGLSRIGTLFSTKQSCPHHLSMRCLRDKASVHSTRIELLELKILRSPTTTTRNGTRQYLIGPSATVFEHRRREGSFPMFSSGAHGTKLRFPGDIPESRGRRMIFASWRRPARCSWIHSKLQVTYTKRLSKRQKHYPKELHRMFVFRSCRRNSPPCKNREPCNEQPGWRVLAAPFRHQK